MTALFEGDFHGKAIKAEFGTDKGGKPQVRVTMEVTDSGERKGVQVQYSGNFKAESIKYTKRDLKALGWTGQSSATIVNDILDASESGLVVPFQVRIAAWTDPKTGKEKKWLSAGSIGYEAPPLSPVSDDMVRNVDSWFAEAEDAPAAAGRSGAYPGPASGGYGGRDAPPPGDDDLPFASSCFNHEPIALARVLLRRV